MIAYNYYKRSYFQTRKLSSLFADKKANARRNCMGIMAYLDMYLHVSIACKAADCQQFYHSLFLVLDNRHEPIHVAPRSNIYRVINHHHADMQMNSDYASNIHNLAV